MVLRWRDERGFTFPELLAAILILGVLIAVALPNYFGAETDAKKQVDQANVRAINSALALYKFKNSGSCPTDATAFDTFLGDTTYFPDGKPVDPFTSTSTPYKDTYSASLCRVQMSAVVGTTTVNHATGAGH